MTTRKFLGLMGLALPAVILFATLKFASADDRWNMTTKIYHQLNGIPGAGISELNVYLSHGIRVKHYSRSYGQFAHGDLEVDDDVKQIGVDIDNDVPGVIVGKIESFTDGVRAFDRLHVSFDPNCKNFKCALSFENHGSGGDFQLSHVRSMRVGMQVLGVDMLGDVFGWRKFPMYRDRAGYYYHEQDHRGFAADYGTNHIVLQIQPRQIGDDIHRVVDAPGVPR